MKNKLILFGILFVIFGVLNFGNDLTLHLHHSWLYNQMISNGEIYFNDPYLLSGEQFSFMYGIPAYLISSFFYPIFSVFTIDILSIIFLALSFYFLLGFIKTDKFTIFCIIMSNLIFVFEDSYVSLVSLLFFNLSLFLFYKKNKFYFIPLIIACLNHPVIIFAALFFVLKNKRNLFFIIPIAIYDFIIILAVSNNTKLSEIYSFFTLVRIIILLAPVIINEKLDLKKFFKKKKRVVNNFCKQFNKNKINVLRYVCLFVGLGLFASSSYHDIIDMTPGFSELILTDVSIGFPTNISGDIRVVDYFSLPAVYHFPKNGIILGVGSYRENNPVHITAEYIRSYNDYLSEINGVDYVLHCKYCNPIISDGLFLNKYYNITWENEYYYLYQII